MKIRAKKVPVWSFHTRQRALLLLVSVLFGNFTTGEETDQEFEKTWCRERKTRTDWQLYTHSCPCYSRHWGFETWSDDLKTDPNLSFIAGAEIKPAGHFSKVYIQSMTMLNRTKSFGGDAWRMKVQGQADLTASMYDMENGTYQAVFLPMEPGTYSLQIFLDYTLCHGLKNPPPGWFRRGCRHGSFQKPGALGSPDDYIDRPLFYGSYYSIQVPPATLEDAQELDSLYNTSSQWCSENCNQLWDGFGRWKNGAWWTYKNDGTSPARSGHRRGSGVLWIYGDSHNRRLYESLQEKPLCSQVFNSCYHSNVWVYLLGSVNSDETDLSYGGQDINVTRVLEELRRVVTQPLMDQDSALVLNAGVHLLKSTSFRNYQKIIRGFIRVLRDNYRGHVVWKTTPSLGKQTELYTGCVRRFHTEQRIKLFNAYAMKRMCEAGILVLDVYPISASYPQGTIDGIHYPDSVFYPAEEALERYFTT